MPLRKGGLILPQGVANEVLRWLRGRGLTQPQRDGLWSRQSKLSRIRTVDGS
jgi:hypothetical protein